jgi:hypothetical protein
MRRATNFCGAALAVALFLSPAVAQNRTADLRVRFERETDPVRKAKFMPELGEGQFAEIREEVRGAQFPEALVVLGQYRAEAGDCERALVGLKINADKHPAGFKELEISLRESLRRLNEMLPGLAADDQAPFLEIRKDLSEMDQRLVHELFPQRP